MSLRFTFKQLDPSEAIKDHSEKKFEKVKRVLPNAFDVHFIFEVNKLEHKAELTFHASKSSFVSSHVSDNLYTSIDLAIDKAMHQVNREKDRLRSY